MQGEAACSTWKPYRNYSIRTASAISREYRIGFDDNADDNQRCSSVVWRRDDGEFWWSRSLSVSPRSVSCVRVELALIPHRAEKAELERQSWLELLCYEVQVKRWVQRIINALLGKVLAEYYIL